MTARTLQGMARVRSGQAPALTGSGSHMPSYGGFGGGHPHFHPHADWQQPNLTISLGIGQIVADEAAEQPTSETRSSRD